jgi:hypothetical protein
MFDLVGVQRTLATYFSGSAPSSRIEHADRQPHRSPDPVGLVRVFTIERELTAGSGSWCAWTMSATRRRVWRDVDAASAEGVDVTPPAGDVEQLEAADGGGQGGVDDELVTDWLKAEHGP